MERSSIKDTEINTLLKNALTDKINDRTVYMKGIDVSYSYEGYNLFKTDTMLASIRKEIYATVKKYYKSI